jgi:predicted enzyme related to lactoylglutathione lyase
MATGNWAWQDLGTSDLDAAKSFYGAVFGWNFVPMPMDGFEYIMIHAGDYAIGGMNGLGEGESPRWIPYISIADIDSAVATIGSSGGTNTSEIHHIPGIVRMSYHTDPDGAEFALFSGEGEWADRSMPTMQAVKSVPIWYELACEHIGAEIGWYQGFTGWGHVEWPMGEGMVYNGLTVGEAPVAGAFDKSVFGDGDNPSVWRIYFEAPISADATAAAIKAAGGTIVQDPAPIPGTGIFLLATDPTGALFGVLESEAM